MKKYILTLSVCFILFIPLSVSAKAPQVQQLIIVTSSSKILSQGTLETYEFSGGEWKRVFSPMNSYIGYRGISTKSKEGDGKTPAGLFSFGTAFGWAEKPKGLKIPYRQTNKYDYWIDDVRSSDYNHWINFTGNPYKRWRSFEKLTHPLYKYAIVIRYNDNPIIKGKGSAIFLHISSPSRKTAGCISLNESNLLSILKWLNPQKNPKIELGNSVQSQQFKRSIGIIK